MRQRFLLVHNRLAGRHGGRKVQDVVARLLLQGAIVTFLPEGLATLPNAIASSPPFDAVIAAGGDGTVRALASQTSLRDIPIGVVPTGTGNVLSHEVGLPNSARGLADVLLNGPVRDFQGGLANGEPFYLMAGVGFDGAVIRYLDTPTKRLLGRLAYTAPVLRALATPPPELDVEVDGKGYHANWVVAAKARRYGGAFVMAPAAGLDRPDLVAVLLHAPRRRQLVSQLLALAAGRLQHASGVTMLPCQSLSVRSRGPVPSEIDGDPFQVTPLSITAGGATVRLIVPEGYA